MKLGDRVIVTTPGEEPDVCVIIEGLVFRNNRAAFKVQYPDFENWVPADWIKPMISSVDDS